MRTDYTPFTKDFFEITADDLAVLRSVAEGWYVEYKREVPNAGSVAKSILAPMKRRKADLRFMPGFAGSRPSAFGLRPKRAEPARSSNGQWWPKENHNGYSTI